MASYDDDRPALSINDRIVWISDNGPEFGFVRWLGRLPDLNNEWMAGVEFDNPVGSGTGLYKDCQLFETELNHASLVPIIGLIKESDFLEPAQSNHLSSGANSRDQSNISLNSSHSSNINHNNHDINYPNLDNYNDSRNRASYDEIIEFNRRTSPSKDHRAQYQARETSKQSKVRVIPVQVENHYNPNDSATKASSSRKSYPNQSTPPIAEKPARLFNSNKLLSNSSKLLIDPVKELSSNLRKTNINSGDKQQHNHHQHQIQQHHHNNSIVNHNNNTTNNHQNNINSNHQQISNLPEPSFVIDPYDPNSIENFKNLLGKSKGIQGHNNSCYLDATLFSMFASTDLFDSLLFRPKTRDDIPEYSEIQKILREDIVIPLRTNKFVSADQVMKFRTVLDKSSTVDGLTDQEKDPEEFLTLLLGQILKAEPYLKLSSGLESFFYQLIVDKDENVILPTVQDLLEQSFLDSTVRLREIPSCLLLQMPRFGSQYKMYPRIMPTLRLDITDILESAPRACGLRVKNCDNIAKYECKSCFSEQSGRHNTRLSSVTYCTNCFQAKHFGKSHSTGIEEHDRTKTLLEKTPIEAINRYSNRLSASNTKDKEIPRIYMDLFAVLCIETSHYVCFVKCGEELDSPWCFFDSMADRRGEQNGYNIPEVVQFDEFAFWTSEKGVACLLNNRDDKLLPEMAKRLICDAYFCFYQFKGLKTFR